MEVCVAAVPAAWHGERAAAVPEAVEQPGMRFQKDQSLGRKAK